MNEKASADFLVLSKIILVSRPVLETSNFAKANSKPRTEQHIMIGLSLIIKSLKSLKISVLILSAVEEHV